MTQGSGKSESIARVDSALANPLIKAADASVNRTVETMMIIAAKLRELKGWDGWKTLNSVRFKGLLQPYIGHAPENKAYSIFALYFR